MRNEPALTRHCDRCGALCHVWVYLRGWNMCGPCYDEFIKPELNRKDNGEGTLLPRKPDGSKSASE